MRVSGVIAVLFIAEIIVIMQVGSAIGGAWTVGWLLLDMLIGAFLISSSGLAPGKPLHAEAFFTRSGNPIATLLRCLAGLLFIFPGFLSDILGLLILMPFARSVLIAVAGKLLPKESPLYAIYTFSRQAEQRSTGNDPLRDTFFRQAAGGGNAGSKNGTDSGEPPMNGGIIEGEFRDVTDDSHQDSHKLP